MSKDLPIDSDPLAVKPIIEALIFASDEPLSARAVVRLLAGDHAKPSDRVPPLIKMIEEAAGGEEEVASEPVEPEVEAPADDAEQPAVGADELADAMERFGGRADDADDESDAPDALDLRYVRRIIEQLNVEYEETNRAFRIVEVAGGFQFATLREYGEYVALLSKEKSRRRLSQAALETLAIIAYRQPASKPEIEAIRGVNCDQVLLNLMEKNLVVITGRSEGVGRPLLYGTTEEFLRIFGLNALSDLPKLREIEELMEVDAFIAERAEVIMIDESTEVEEIEARVGAVGHLHGHDGEEQGEAADETAATGESDAASDTDVINEESVSDAHVES